MNLPTATPTTSTPDVPTFQELSPTDKIVKTTLGTVLFIGWLLLFIFGMSLRAEDYRTCIFLNDKLNPNYLLLYAVAFTPTNVAVLAALAGVLGGFASNLAASNQFRHLRPTTVDPKSEDFSSYLYMTENPLVSMLRGFITYLIFIAGSYLTNFTSSGTSTGPASFIGLTASDYFKFAVSVSLLAYLAGYDPSRMKSLINSVGFTRKDPPASTETKTFIHQTNDIAQVATTGPQPSSPVNGQPVKPT